ncbi:hypothetical protein BDN72DRAFT_847819 [Pluteus cervinus]|uniref:Uncharacterized protein n=1 Tax=Pluteus cervinus TaxID=181527 RepID=A0ACD3ABY5_9AGAR|nr:hypothetical protein BDN72DRAFT_847819 [Pluteus cervinus]
MTPLPTCKDLIVILGLAQGTSPYVPRPIQTEAQRGTYMQHYLDDLYSGSGDHREIVCAEFCAKYLPAAVDRFIDAPIIGASEGEPLLECFELFNAMFFVLMSIYHIPYFTKYMGSRQPVASRGKHLARIIAERMIRFAVFCEQKMENIGMNEEEYAESLTSALTLLNLLVLVFAKDQIPLSVDMRNGLARHLLKWMKSSNRTLRQNSYAVYTSMKTTKSSGAVEDAMRKDLKIRSKCGWPGCTTTVNMKACERCHIVCYCSPEHQKAHWNSQEVPAHKPTCFKTEY